MRAAFARENRVGTGPKAPPRIEPRGGVLRADASAQLRAPIRIFAQGKEEFAIWVLHWIGT